MDKIKFNKIGFIKLFPTEISNLIYNFYIDEFYSVYKIWKQHYNRYINIKKNSHRRLMPDLKQHFTSIAVEISFSASCKNFDNYKYINYLEDKDYYVPAKKELQWDIVPK
jgi:hypothetical protein